MAPTPWSATAVAVGTAQDVGIVIESTDGGQSFSTIFMDDIVVTDIAIAYVDTYTLYLVGGIDYYSNIDSGTDATGTTTFGAAFSSNDGFSGGAYTDAAAVTGFIFGVSVGISSDGDSHVVTVTRFVSGLAVQMVTCIHPLWGVMACLMALRNSLAQAHRSSSME